MKKHLLLTLIVSMLSLTGFSQQDPQFTNYMFSRMAFNPGYAGISEAICATALMRQQWMGFTETGENGERVSPQTMFLTVDALVKPLHGGIGLTVINDKIGYDDVTAVRLAYSFHLNVGPGKLGIGLQGGAINKRIDFSKYDPKDQGDIILNSQNVESAMSFDLAFGAYYKTQKWYAGFSSTQIPQASVDFGGTIGSPQYQRHYYIHGGYHYQLPTMPNVVINPNAIIKTDFASAQYDLSVLGWYNNMVYAGVNYRVQDAVSILAGVKAYKGLKVGIAYDVTTSQLGREGRSIGTAEVYVNYCFKIIPVPKTQSHGNVRFLF